MGESFRDRDPTNPLDRKIQRDQQLREGMDERGDSSGDDDAPPLKTTLRELELKYGGADPADLDDAVEEVVVSIEEAREWGQRDGQRAVQLAREEASDLGFDVMDTKVISRAMGVPAPDEPGSPARLVCTQRAYINQGIYFGPDLPLAGLISREASRAFRSTEEAGSAYWDAFELEARRANVSIVVTTHQEMYDDGPTAAIYVVDRNRFPVFNEKEATNYSKDDVFNVEETLVQFAFQPAKRRFAERLRKPFRRST